MVIGRDFYKCLIICGCCFLLVLSFPGLSRLFFSPILVILNVRVIISVVLGVAVIFSTMLLSFGRVASVPKSSLLLFIKTKSAVLLSVVIVSFVVLSSAISSSYAIFSVVLNYSYLSSAVSPLLKSYHMRQGCFFYPVVAAFVV